MQTLLDAPTTSKPTVSQADAHRAAGAYATEHIDPAFGIVDGALYFSKLLGGVRDGQEYVADGEYLEIDRPRRLVLTFRMAQFSPTIDRVIVDIAPLAQGCQVTVTQEITVPHEDSLTPQELETLLAGHKSETEQGWNQGFDLLATMLA